MVLVCGTNEGLYARCRPLSSPCCIDSPNSPHRLKFQHVTPGDVPKLHDFDVPLDETVRATVLANDIFEMRVALTKEPIHSPVHTLPSWLPFPLYQELNQYAKDGSFFSYIAGAAAVMINKYRNSHKSMQMHGIEIQNYMTTLPMRKGLSSSAAACVLVVKCFAKVYDIEMDMATTMELAYLGSLLDNYYLSPSFVF